MSKSPQRTFNSDFKQFFLRGLVVLLPSILTLWIVVKAYQFVDNTIAEPINRGIRVAMINTARVWEPMRKPFEPSQEDIEEAFAALQRPERTTDRLASLGGELRAKRIDEWWASHWYMDLIGIAVAIIAVYIAGRLLGGFLGRRIYRRIEGLITTFPVVKQVYPHVKQIVDFLFSDDRQLKFNRVVVCEYPRQGIWSVGFLTGNTMRSIADHSGDSVTVFIPSSPTPFTGYTITLPKESVIELPVSVEEAIRFAVSGGVLIPDHQKIEAAVPSLLKTAPRPLGPAGQAGEETATIERKEDEETGDRRRRDAG